MDFIAYILDNCLILVPALYIVGRILKATPGIPDWTIPFALLALGIAGCVGMSLRPESDMDAVEAVVQGVLVTGAAVLVHQGIKQVQKQN